MKIRDTRKSLQPIQSAGFTLVELLVAIAVSGLLLVALTSLLDGVTRQYGISAARSAMATQLAVATDKAYEDAEYSVAILKNNTVNDPSGPASSGGMWSSTSEQLVLGATARDAEGNSLTGSYPGEFDNIVYYLRGGSLYRRFLAFDSTENRHSTAVCPPVGLGGCLADTKLADNVKSLEITYYDATGGIAATVDQAVTIDFDLTLEKSQSGQLLTTSSEVRLALLLEPVSVDLPPEPVATAVDCFELDNGGTRIRDYYEYELDNSANPPCPRDVVIPNFVTHIYHQAMNSINLTSVTFLRSVEGIEIGQSAFSFNKISTITFPSTNVTIGQAAFRDNKLTSLVIPESVKEIGQSAFGWNQISSITFPSTNVTIGQAAFRDNRLTSIVIPEWMTEISQSAFAWNQISSITFPSTNVTIDQAAFRSNELTSIVIPESVKEIGPSVFMENNLLLTASVPYTTVMQSNSFPSSVAITRY